MTYRDMLNKLSTLSPAQLDTNVTILDMNGDEVYPATDFVTGWSSPNDGSSYTHGQRAMGVDQVDGVLDEGHPYLTFIS